MVLMVLMLLTPTVKNATTVVNQHGHLTESLHRRCFIDDDENDVVVDETSFLFLMMMLTLLFMMLMLML